MERTIKTVVKYTLNQDGQRVMASLGFPAQANQKITLDIPLSTKGLYINHDGIGILEFEYTHYPKLSSDFLPVPDDLHGGKDDLPYVHHCQAKVWTNGQYGIPTPLLSVDDVLIFIASETAKIEAITAQLPAKQAEYDAKYEAEVVAQKARIQHLTDVAEARKQLENQYSYSLQKLNQLRDLIDGKQRVRTAQIVTILEG